MTTTNQPIPAPWMVKNGVQVCDADGAMLAQSWCRDDGTEEGIATLIAAIPELLKCLECLEEAVKENPNPAWLAAISQAKAKLNPQPKETNK